MRDQSIPLSTTKMTTTSSASVGYMGVLIMSSIMSSVALILTNKFLMTHYHFGWILTLSACHFLTTAGFTHMLRTTGLFGLFPSNPSDAESRRTSVSSQSSPLLTSASLYSGHLKDQSLKIVIDPSPRVHSPLVSPSTPTTVDSSKANRIRLQMAVFGTMSIVFMNYNLQLNSVWFYQLTKLLCIPYMILFHRVSAGKKVTRELVLTLLFILVGVGMATIMKPSSPTPKYTSSSSDPDAMDESTDRLDATTETAWTALIGYAVGLLSVVTTSHFQIWQGQRQSELGLSAIQLADFIMPTQFMVCFVCALALEIIPSIFGRVQAPEVSIDVFGVILLTCCWAIAVNLVTYLLIGKTSAVTFQVVGHLKTILTLVGGYVLFSAVSARESLTPGQLVGVAVALLGMMLYGDVKNAQSGRSLLCRLTKRIDYWTREL